MGFLHKAVNAIFYPAVVAGKVASSAGKKVESVFDGILDTIVMFVESSLGLLLIGGTTALLLLARNPKMALLAL